MKIGSEKTRLWLRGRADVLLPEVHWSDFLGLHIKVSLDRDTEPQTAPDVLIGTLHGSHCHQCMNVCMNYCKSTKAKCPKCPLPALTMKKGGIFKKIQNNHAEKKEQKIKRNGFIRIVWHIPRSQKPQDPK